VERGGGFEYQRSKRGDAEQKKVWGEGGLLVKPGELGFCERVRGNLRGLVREGTRVRGQIRGRGTRVVLCQRSGEESLSVQRERTPGAKGDKI